MARRFFGAHAINLEKRGDPGGRAAHYVHSFGRGRVTYSIRASSSFILATVAAASRSPSMYSRTARLMT